MNFKNRIKWGILGFLSAIAFILLFASIFGSDPLTLIKDKFIIGTIIEPYFKFLCLLIFLIMLAYIIHKKNKDYA
ncbi:hypothetical protein GCM10008905_08710 [Clostridium malenominatum]|uniref:Uncharacterized protein n=1 Tax=Clostridium malenominatum TaxID=1539 RepID=A0ABP3TZL8_9CLOT